MILNRKKIIDESQKWLDIISSKKLSEHTRRQIVSETLDNFEGYYNKGFLEYRKSVTESDGFAAVEWNGSGSYFMDVLGRKYLDLLGGFGIYSAGIRHPKIVKAVRDQLKRMSLSSQELLDPLRGAAVMVIESKLLYALVDSFFGGNDVPYTKIEGKDFTPIEIKIARRVVLSAIDDYEKAWEPVYPLKVGYSRTEINPQFVAVVPPSDVVIATTFDVELEKVSGTIKIVISYAILEPIKSKLSVGFQSEQLEVDFIWINRIKEQIMGTSANVLVKLGEADISLRDIMELQAGDIIQLDTDATMPLDIQVEGIPKFKGIPGLLKGNRALKIVESLIDV